MRTEQEVQNGSKPKRRFNIADDAVRRRKEEDDETQLIVVCYPNKLWAV